ncbi:MAG: RNA-binding S4 domain-containing protein [Sphingomonadales bacterium]|nr:RNA-binding S4 domain-containing protein [Sphingomonadales bacterium]
MTDLPGGRLRLDQWLFHARFFKSRSLAAKQCRARKIRINGEPQTKASAQVAVGDVLTFPKAGRIVVVRIAALGTRRGPAPEARGLYEDLSPPPKSEEKDTAEIPQAVRDKGAGRPTKAHRRAIERLKRLFG